MRMGVPWRDALGPSGRSMRVVVLLAALVLQLRPTAGQCPKLDCVMKRRASCTPGSIVCGSCLPVFIEDEKGNCVQNPSAQNEMRHGADDFGNDIDYIASILAKSVNSLQASHSNAVVNSLEAAKVQDESRVIRAGQQSVKIVTTSTPQHRSTKVAAVKSHPKKSPVPVADAVLLTLIIVCTVAGVSGLIIAGICWYRLRKEAKLSQKTDYVGYGVTGSNAQIEKSVNGDNKLAQSAQMYHYQHQKQQMLSMEKNKDESKVPDSATESEGENEDGDFTVYECPGLAPTGEMEVKNPLFDDSSLHHPPTSS